jgi:two-component system chemotaxis response regulator CheY
VADSDSRPADSAPDKSAVQARRASRGQAYDLSALRFLIVEQHLVMRLLYRSLLRAFDILHVADSGDMIEALQRFQRSSPDVILLDWSPSFPGLDFLKMVRSPKSPNRFVPVILISSYTEPVAVLQARDAGVTSFLAKPVTAQLIYQRICMAIENQRPFIDTATFFGPDRRVHEVPFEGAEKRKGAQPTAAQPTAEPAAEPAGEAPAEPT